YRRAFWRGAIRPAGADRVSGVVFADRSGLRHCLAHGFDTGVPCHHQSISDSAVAAFGGAVPSLGRFGMAALADATESAHLRRGSFARIALPRNRFAGLLCGNLAL